MLEKPVLAVFKLKTLLQKSSFKEIDYFL